MKIIHKLLIIAFATLVIVFVSQILYQAKSETCISTAPENNITNENTFKESAPSTEFECIDLGVPPINSSFKTWMSYEAVTDKQSPQYTFINTYGWTDTEGFMRASGESDLGVEQDYYMIALGSYYGTTIGTKYRITLDTGKVFYGALADCKDNKHTNSTNQYVPQNGSIVEFLVDTPKLNKDVKKMGSANVYMPLNGSVVKIEKINFIK